MMKLNTKLKYKNNFKLIPRLVLVYMLLTPAANLLAACPGFSGNTFYAKYLVHKQQSGGAGGSDSFQAVGKNFYSSSDGIYWDEAISSTPSFPEGKTNALVFAQQKFLLVGENASAWYSTDGLNWHIAQGLHGHADFMAVTYAAGKFVAVAQQSTVWYSLDGENWLPGQGLDGQAHLMAVTYAAGKFVAVGGLATSWYSDDGINWRKGQGLNGKSIFNAIIYADNKFVTVGDYATSWYSADGIHWLPGQGLSTTHAFNAITYAAGKFVAVGDNAMIWYSEDGQNWHKVKGIAGSAAFRAITYAQNKFVAVADKYTSWYSTDGVNWQISEFKGSLTVDPKTRPLDFLYANGEFEVIYQNLILGDPFMYHSRDGITWYQSRVCIDQPETTRTSQLSKG